MNLAALLKLLWDAKVITMAPGVASLVLLGYVELYQLQPLEAQVTGVEDSIKALQLNQLEERMDAAYSALCSNPGDPALLERIRELQQEYAKIAGKRYDQPDCSLLLKLNP